MKGYFDPVEDTKGNNGQRGFLRITNLRLIWEAHKAYRVNLSIGFKAILNMNQKSVRSKLRGNIEALHVLAQVLVLLLHKSLLLRQTFENDLSERLSLSKTHAKGNQFPIRIHFRLC